MKKILSLMRACMTDNMSLFKIRKKSKTQKNGKSLTIILSLFFAFSIWTYANTFMDSLIEQHNEPVLLTLFVAITAILIIVEGVYKSGSLLFNCKDDDLLLSLPIRKSTVVFIRIFKFYLFEVLYSALFMVPVLVVYAMRAQTSPTFYLVSVMAVILLPVVPVAISSIIGALITSTSARFKQRNLAQVVISMAVLLGVLYLSFNMQSLLTGLGENAQYIGESISRYYYPADALTKLATNFTVQDVLMFVGINAIVFVASIFLISGAYFRINSRLKTTPKSNGGKDYKVKVSSQFNALVKKDLKKVCNTPVLVTNAIFGMVLFVVICCIVVFNVDSFSVPDNVISKEQILAGMPLILYVLIAFGSFTSSLTSSMISLEGKTFVFLKSMPVNPYRYIMAKVATAMLMIVPFVFIGDIIFFVKFKFGALDILMILIASLVLPFITEVFGILVNLKYPKMDAETDAEVVKQSSSSNVCAITGLLLTGLTIGIAAGLIAAGCNSVIGMVILNVIYGLIAIILVGRVKKNGSKRFMEIE